VRGAFSPLIWFEEKAHGKIKILKGKNWKKESQQRAIPVGPQQKMERRGLLCAGREVETARNMAKTKKEAHRPKNSRPCQKERAFDPPLRKKGDSQRRKLMSLGGLPERRDEVRGGNNEDTTPTESNKELGG